MAHVVMNSRNAMGTTVTQIGRRSLARNRVMTKRVSAPVS